MDKPPLSSHPLVLVEWQDSFGVNSGWEDIEDLEYPKATEQVICLSVGWLVKDGPEAILIVPHVHDESNTVCGAMLIPRRALLAITLLSSSGPLELATPGPEQRTDLKSDAG